MDSLQQLCYLRREYEEAVESYNFDQAEHIDNQIQCIKKSLKKQSDKETTEKRTTSLEENEDLIASALAQRDAEYTRKKAEVQKDIMQRFNALQEKQAKELQDLTDQHLRTLEREQTRPVPEVESIRIKAKQFAREHDYVSAKNKFKEGEDLRKTILAQRELEVTKLYDKSKATLLAKHEREQAVIIQMKALKLSRIESEFEKVDIGNENRTKVLSFNAEKKKTERQNLYSSVSPPSSPMTKKSPISPMKSPSFSAIPTVTSPFSTVLKEPVENPYRRSERIFFGTPNFYLE